MMFHYLDKKVTPYMNNMQRLTTIIYLLGFTTKEQLITITGWPADQVVDTLQRIRKQGKTSEARDSWLKIWKTGGKGSINLYSLGQKSVNLAASLRKEDSGTGKFQKKELKEGQMYHFLGNNEILIRLLKAGAVITDYKTGKEVMSHIKAAYKERYFDEHGVLRSKSKDYLDFKPDSSVTVSGGMSAFLEYDTGSEGPTKLGERVENYVQGYTNASERTKQRCLLPIAWITSSEYRKRLLKDICEDIVAKYQDDYRQPIFPEMYCFVEGEETDFLLGKTKAEPIMIGTLKEEHTA